MLMLCSVEVGIRGRKIEQEVCWRLAVNAKKTKPNQTTTKKKPGEK